MAGEIEIFLQPTFLKEVVNIKKKKKGLVVLIDWDNIDSALSLEKKRLDLAGLLMQLLGIGEINFLKVFVPPNSVNLLPLNMNSLGYEIVVCQKIGSYNSDKREDKVDSYLYINGVDLVRYKENTTVVLLTHDKHSTEFCQSALKKKKEVIYFAQKEKMGKELMDFIESFGIKVYPLPTKDRPSLGSL